MSRTTASGVPIRGRPDDADLGQAPVIDKDLTAPPGAPSLGDRYIVASVASGAWTGQEDDIAQWAGSAWVFETPIIGVWLYVDDETEYYSWNGAAWVQESFGPHAATHTSGSDKLPATYSGDVLRRDASDWIDTQINAASVDYLVGPVGQARFQTIQAAIDQADSDGFGPGNEAMVHILNGTYTEDLTLKAGIWLRAVELGERVASIPTTGGANVIIVGNHTLVSGEVRFWGLRLEGGAGSSTFTYSGGVGGKRFNFYGCFINSASGQSLVTFATGSPEYVTFVECHLSSNAATLFTGGVFPIVELKNCFAVRSGGAGDIAVLTAGALTCIGNRNGDASRIQGRIHVSSGAPIVSLRGYILDASAEHVQVDVAAGGGSFFENCVDQDGNAITIAGAQAATFKERPLAAIAGDVWRHDGNQFVLYPGEVTNEVSTTDATVTTIATIPIPDDTAVWIEANIINRRTDASDRGKFKRGALVYREAAGAATIEGAVWTPLTIKSVIPSQWDVEIAVSGNNALLQVTGLAGHTINWESRHTVEERS